MPKFKPGDRVIGPMVGQEWLYVGHVGDHHYVAPVQARGGSTNAIPFPGDMDGWKLAPKPFFEEKKNYQFGQGQVVSIWHVVELAHGPVAVGQSTNGTPCMMTSLDGWHEVR